MAGGEKMNRTPKGDAFYVKVESFAFLSQESVELTNRKSIFLSDF